jgi:hypothetical protein
MTDSKYFTTTKKGEIFELKSELNNDKKEKKKEAVKKVIASMTVGKDVSALFPDVVNCMQTDNLELKKLVYLYLMNYAKSQPDMAIMAVNTFVKVSIFYYSQMEATSIVDFNAKSNFFYLQYQTFPDYPPSLLLPSVCFTLTLHYSFVAKGLATFTTDEGMSCAKHLKIMP